MIKRIFLTSLLVLGTFLITFADEQKKIIVNNDNHRIETVDLGYCYIFVSLKDVDNDERAEIIVELENTNESNTLLLFEEAYDEKALKKMSTSIRYDKKFPGSKGKRNIDQCVELTHSKELPPSEKSKLFTKTMRCSTPNVCRLPIYIAKEKTRKGFLSLFKPRSRFVLLEKEVIELEIFVQLKSDEEYINITESYENLIREINTETFCSNKNHRGKSLKSLKDEYESKIFDLKNRITAIIESRGYYPSDKAYEKFKEVLNELDSISINDKIVDSCSKDRKIISGHKCKNCSLTYEAIYKKLENYYIDIHNGKKTKDQIMTEVESLYKCVSKNKSRPANNSIKSRITTYYKKIKSL